MEKFRSNLAWKYITAKDEATQNNVLLDILDKYKDTSIECDALNYEINVLVDEIIKDDSFTDYKTFLSKLNAIEAQAVYDYDLDYKIYKKIE